MAVKKGPSISTVISRHSSFSFFLSSVDRSISGQHQDGERNSPSINLHTMQFPKTARKPSRKPSADQLPAWSVPDKHPSAQPLLLPKGTTSQQPAMAPPKPMLTFASSREQSGRSVTRTSSLTFQQGNLQSQSLAETAASQQSSNSPANCPPCMPSLSSPYQNLPSSGVPRSSSLAPLHSTFAFPPPPDLEDSVPASVYEGVSSTTDSPLLSSSSSPSPSASLAWAKQQRISTHKHSPAMHATSDAAACLPPVTPTSLQTKLQTKKQDQPLSQKVDVHGTLPDQPDMQTSSTKAPASLTLSKMKTKVRKSRKKSAMRLPLLSPPHSPPPPPPSYETPLPLPEIESPKASSLSRRSSVPLPSSASHSSTAQSRTYTSAWEQPAAQSPAAPLLPPQPTESSDLRNPPKSSKYLKRVQSTEL